VPKAKKCKSSKNKRRCKPCPSILCAAIQLTPVEQTSTNSGLNP
jgi:hypothetical protein